MNVEKRITNLIAKNDCRRKNRSVKPNIKRATNKEKLKELIKRSRVGSIIIASSCFAGSEKGKVKNIEYFEELQRTAVKENRLGIPIKFGRDETHGHYTVYQLSLVMASSFNDELVKMAYSDIAREAALDFVQVTFTPMLELSRDPRWGRCVEGQGMTCILESEWLRHR